MRDDARPTLLVPTYAGMPVSRTYGYRGEIRASTRFMTATMSKVDRS
jgi:hypothetical protein